MPILAALSNALGTQHEIEAQEVLTALVEVAQNAVDFFRENLVNNLHIYSSLEQRKQRPFCVIIQLFEITYAIVCNLMQPMFSQLYSPV